jgi:hypothetical protein
MMQKGRRDFIAGGLALGSLFVLPCMVHAAEAEDPDVDADGADTANPADSFRYISSILAMVLGLGLTRMLVGLVSMFRSRDRARLDWVPVAWAFCIFVTDLQYWWAVNNLPPGVISWTFELFVALVVFTMLLFVSAALLLPPAEMEEGGDLRVFFDREGRWSLLFLSAYFLLTIAINAVYFGVSILRPWTALEVAMFALTLSSFFARSRAVLVLLTMVAVPMFSFYCMAFSDDWLWRFIQ